MRGSSDSEHNDSSAGVSCNHQLVTSSRWLLMMISPASLPWLTCNLVSPVHLLGFLSFVDTIVTVGHRTPPFAVRDRVVTVFTQFNAHFHDPRSFTGPTSPFRVNDNRTTNHTLFIASKNHGAARSH